MVYLTMASDDECFPRISPGQDVLIPQHWFNEKKTKTTTRVEQNRQSVGKSDFDFQIICIFDTYYKCIHFIHSILVFIVLVQTKMCWP